MSTIGLKPAGRPRKFGESLHPLTTKFRFQCGHCDGCYGGWYLKKKVANLNRRNFPIRFDFQKATEAQGFVSLQQFERWFENLCAHLAIKYGPCNIQLDGASYHKSQTNSAPNSRALKDDIQAWLEEKEIWYDTSNTKAE
ncbi:hypothetical protein PI124_g16371 [Phytophthora idaei]|nr:hypothetical protein PI126_g15529 [Phytophthora idaei]KAG3238669.1 hypothetical protein PI124_g16371 [Phytophthora idaei]